MTLSDNEVETRLKTRPGWTYDPAGKSLTREFRFPGFAEAFAFMTRVAIAAEKADHHPDWSNTYNKVTVRLSTHSAGGVTEKDFALAEVMDKAFKV